MSRSKLMRDPAEDVIAEEIRKNYGGMMNLATVQSFLGVKDCRTARRFLNGVTSYSINGRSMWMASDIAHRLVEVRDL